MPATYAGRYSEVLIKDVGGRLRPATNATVTVYEDDGTTVATIYTTRTKAVEADNPVSPDAHGNLEFFAEPGTYVLSVVENATVQDTTEITVPYDPEEVTIGVTTVDGNTGAITAAQLLTAIKTVDGAGSGLDADLLDGSSSGDFATSGHNHDASYATSGHTHSYASTAQGALADSAVQPGDDAADLGSGAATDGYVLTADGAGGAAWEAASGGGGGGATNLAWSAATSTVTSDTGTDATLTAVDGSNPGLMTVAMKSKLDGIEAGADVTDAANVAAAGAVMEADTSTAAMSFVVDEDNMASNSATKVPTQQSVKAYVDALSGTYVALTDYEDADVLAKVKNVDGTGSGLDADLLDGLNASAFAEADGEYAVNTVAASGATETLTLAPAHRVTMDQNCTFTFPTPTAGHTFLLWLSGAFTPTFPASVDWNSATAPTYATPSLYGFTTLDGGTTWAGTLIASGLG